FAMATNRWALAMSGVAASTGQVSGAVGKGVAGITTMASGTQRLASGLGRAAANAGGIPSALTVTYTLTSMIVEELGWFEDEHKALPTADDPRAEAAKARSFREQAQAE